MDKKTLELLANKLKFTMDDSEYDTLAEAFDIILKQMDLIGKIEFKASSNMEDLSSFGPDTKFDNLYFLQFDTENDHSEISFFSFLIFSFLDFKTRKVFSNEKVIY